MRRDRAAKERRRQAAQARQVTSQTPSKAPRPPVPTSVAEALALAAERGWTATRVKDGYRLTHPSGATAMLHLSISDGRGWRNLRADLIRPTRTERNGNGS